MNYCPNCGFKLKDKIQVKDISIPIEYDPSLKPGEWYLKSSGNICLFEIVKPGTTTELNCNCSKCSPKCL